MPAVANTLLLLNSSPQVWRAMEEFHRRLCRAIRDQGSEVAVVFANPPAEAVRQRFEDAGAVVYALPYRRRRAFYTGVGRIIRDHNIGLVHIRFFRLKHLVAWIVRAHGVRNIVYTDAESGVHEARGAKRWLKAARIRLTTWPNARIIAISQFVKHRLVECGVAAEKIAVIHNGIDLARFTPDPARRSWLIRQTGAADDELLLVTIARLHPVKRIDVLLEACALLRRAAVPFRFVIVGPGGPAAEDLRRKCAELRLDQRVVWAGQTGQPEHYLQACDLFLLASDGEAFGNVLVEAMACGAPVVGSRSGAIPEIIDDRSSGLLADAGSPQSFADKIIALADPVVRRQFAQAAVIRAQRFSAASAVEHTVQLFASLCCRSSSD